MRKIIQLVQAPEYYWLAVCDDGTVWSAVMGVSKDPRGPIDFVQWVKVELDLPGTGE